MELEGDLENMGKRVGKNVENAFGWVGSALEGSLKSVALDGVLNVGVGDLVNWVGYADIDGAKEGKSVGFIEGTGGSVGLPVGLKVGATLKPFTFPKERKVSCIFL